MLNVIKFIQENSFEQLTEQFGICVTSDNEAAPNLVCLNYDQIASPKSHPITQECRGLIINKDTLEVVSRSFDRFYNYGEVPEQTKKVDFSRSVVLEKLDGSLINWYFDKVRNQWVLASRGTTSGRNAITKSRHSYHHLISLALGVDVSDMNPLVDEYPYTRFDAEFDPIIAEQYNWLDMARYNEYLSRINARIGEYLVKGNTYITELVSPHINIVTQYSQTRVYLLGLRNIATGDYVNVNFSRVTEPSVFASPEVYHATSVEEVVAITTKMSKRGDMLQEGVVVFDPINGIRTKIKNTVYLKAHRNLGREIDEKSILELVAAHEDDEYLAYYPSDHKLFLPYQLARTKVTYDLHTLITKANTCIANGDTINVVAKWLKDEKNSEFIFPAIKKELKSGKLVFAAGGENARIRAIKAAIESPKSKP